MAIFAVLDRQICLGSYAIKSELSLRVAIDRSKQSIELLLIAWANQNPIGSCAFGLQFFNRACALA